MWTKAEKARTTNPSLARKENQGKDPFFAGRSVEAQLPGSEAPFFAPVQPKLEISRPDDPFEKEAEQMADRVMKSAASPQVAASGSTDQGEEKEDHSSTPVQTLAPRLHAGSRTGFQTCQRRAAPGFFPSPEVEEIPMAATAEGLTLPHLQTRLPQGESRPASLRGPPGGEASFSQRLLASKGSGRPLPDATRRFMESRFQAPFTGVRIHTDVSAQELAEEIHAQAFTHGQDIYFNAGKFEPESKDGKHLIAHELTHTLQQRGSPVSAPVSPARIQRKATLEMTYLGRKQALDGEVEDPAWMLESPNLARMGAELGSTQSQSQAQSQAQSQSLAGGMNTTGGAWSGSGSTGTDIPTGAMAVSSQGALVSRFAKPPTGDSQLDSQLDFERDEEADAGQRDLDRSLALKSASGREGRSFDPPAFLESAVQRRQRLEEPDGTLKEQEISVSGARGEDLPLQAYATVAARGPPVLGRTVSPRIQPGWFSDALTWVDAALDYAAEGLDRGRQLILEEAKDFALAIPGYRGLRIVLGQDPITGAPITRSGSGFFEAALDFIPAGPLLYEKLQEWGILSQATRWIDEQIPVWARQVASIRTAITQFFRQLSLADLARPLRIFERAGSLLYGVISKIMRFCQDVARALMDMVKRVLLEQVAEFVRARTTVYPLLTVLLGKDPLTGQVVAKSGATILDAMLALAGQRGLEQRRQMIETGTWERAVAWIDEGVHVFSGAYEEMSLAFEQVWSLLTPSAIAHPLATFHQVLDLFWSPVRRVADFVARATQAILALIKEVLLRRLSAWAQSTRGYPLLTVILGRDPFTGARVPRTVDRLVHGFMNLTPQGAQQYEQMKESGAIDRANQRIMAAVTALNLTPAYIQQLFIQQWNAFRFEDLARPLQAFMRIMGSFQEVLGRLIRFLIQIVRILVEVLLQMMNFPVRLVSRILSLAMEAFDRISNQPIQFLMNLVAAIRLGFAQFFRRIGVHLLQGVVGWLMAELRDAGMPVLQDFSLQGVIRWVLEVLGVSVEKIWEKLAAHPQIGPERVARLRQVIGRVEGIWRFIRDVQERGIAAIWEWISERLTQLWDTVLGAVRQWIMERIITQMVTRLLALLDPTGIMAVIQSVLAIYRAIQSFIRYLREMLEIFHSFVEGVVEIASGRLQTAANALENSMAGAMPVVIGFLANQLGLRGLGRRVGTMIEQARAMVDQALTWLVNKAVRWSLPLLQRALQWGRSVGERVMGWLGIRRPVQMLNGEQHTLYFETRGAEPVLMLASNPRRYIDFVQDFDAQTPELQAHKTAALGIAREIDRAIRTRRRDEDGQPSQTHQGTQIAQLIDRLVEHTRHFEVTGGQQPPSVVRYGPVNEDGGGTYAHAEILTKKNIQGGRPSGKPQIMLLAERRRPVQAFIQGHLLNENLGGKGNSYNLTPITGVGASMPGGGANTKHLHEVETHVKKLVLDEGKVVDYRVEAKYEGRNNRRSFYEQLSEKRRQGTATDLELRKLEVMDYEDRKLCTRLINTWCVREKNPQSGRWERVESTCQQVEVKNELPDGDFSLLPN